MITGLDHIQIAIPAGAEDAARRFYAGLLGFEEIAKPPTLVGRGGCWFQGRGIQIHLGVEADFRPAAKAHPAFLIADLELLRQRLAQAGVRLTPDDAIPGVRRFYANDPFGNRIEFIQDGEGFSQ